MAEFAFDLSALVLPPAALAPLPPPPTSTRPSARFEDHLGQAVRTPRESAPEPPRQSAADERESATSAAPAAPTAPKPPQESAEAPENDTLQQSAKQKDKHDEHATGEEPAAEAETANSAEAAAAAADRAAPLQKATAKHHAAPSDQTSAAETRDKSAKRGERALAKAARQSASAEKERTAKLSGEMKASDAKDSQAAEQVPDDGSGTESTLLDGQTKLAAEAAAEPVTGDQRDVAAANVPTMNGPASQETGSSQISAAKEAKPASAVAAPESAEPAEQAQPVDSPAGAKRTRSAKSADSAATSTAQRPSADAGAASEALAPGSGTTQRTLENSAAVTGPAANKDAAREDARPADHNEKNDPRPTSAPALLAARHEKGFEPNGRADSLTEAERVRFVQRVATAFRSLGDEGGEVRLRLSPPELGSLRLELTVRDGVLNARLETDTSTARNLLLDNLPALRDRLAEQNIKVEKFDVDVRDERRQSSGEQFNGQTDLPQQQRGRQRALDNRATAATTQRATRGATRHGDASELNIVI